MMLDFREIGGAQLGDLEPVLSELASGDRTVGLKFDNHWTDDSAGPALLSAALMGSLANLDVTVDVVDDEAVAKLLHFGVASALWRRPRERTHFTLGAKALDEASLGSIWTVGARAAAEALFAAETTPSSAFGPDNATFVNPHLSSGENGRPDVLFLLGRWLYRRFGTAPIVASVERVIGELVANVHQHAAGSSGADFESLVRVGFDACAVHCTVLDTGTGLCDTLADKLPDHKGPPSQLLEDLLAGRLPHWHHGRGIGFGEVLSIAARHGGSVSLATGLLRSTVANGASPTVNSGDFSLQGTVVDVVLPIA